MSGQFYRKCQGAPLWNITGDRLPGGHLLLLSRIAAPLASSFFLLRWFSFQLTLVYSFDHVFVCVSPVLLRYIILKLNLNLIEMGSSFLQLVVADSLGRLFLIPFPFDRFFSTRKTFLIICGLGTGATTLIFAAVFSTASPSDVRGALKKGISFGEKNPPSHFWEFSVPLKISISQLQDLFDLASLAPVLTHPGLILATLALYCCFYNIGFGPIKHTLLR